MQIFVSLSPSANDALIVKAINQIWNLAPSSSLGQIIVYYYLTVLHGKPIKLVGYQL